MFLYKFFYYVLQQLVSAIFQSTLEISVCSIVVWEHAMHDTSEQVFQFTNILMFVVQSVVQHSKAIAQFFDSCLFFRDIAVIPQISNDRTAVQRCVFAIADERVVVLHHRFQHIVDIVLIEI